MSDKKRDFLSRYCSSRFVKDNRLASELEDKMMSYIRKKVSKKIKE